MPHRVVWTVAFEDGPRRVELEHRRLSGRITIRVDGVRVESAPESISKLCKSPFVSIAGHRCAFLVSWNFLGWKYELVMDSRSMDTGLTVETEALAPRPNIPLIQAAAFGIALGSLAMTAYAGIGFVLPFVAALAVYGTLLVSTERKRTKLNSFFPAIAVQAGHVLWMIFGLVTIVGSAQYRWYWDLLPEKYVYFLEPAMLLIGLLVLIIRPTILSVVLLFAIHIYGLWTGAHSLLADGMGLVQVKGTIVHSVLRVAAMIFLIFGLRFRE